MGPSFALNLRYSDLMLKRYHPNLAKEPCHPDIGSLCSSVVPGGRVAACVVPQNAWKYRNRGHGDNGKYTAFNLILKLFCGLMVPVSYMWAYVGKWEVCPRSEILSSQLLELLAAAQHCTTLGVDAIYDCIVSICLNASARGYRQVRYRIHV